MRRGAMAVLATVLGTGLMVGAKLGHAAPDALSTTADDAGGGTVAAGAGTPTGTAAAGGATPAAGAPSGTAAASGKPSAKPSTAASVKPGASKPASPAASKAPTGQYKDGTYTGPGVSERYGTITVTITVSGGRISGASGACSCSGESKSISQNAFGKLNPRVLTAQSASISAVSGATYTSTAYIQSLSSAVDAARA